MAQDIELIGADIFWSASKRPDFRARVQAVFKTLVVFMQANGLVTRELLAQDNEVDETFVVRRSDLTDEGFEFYKQVEQKWLGAIDRGVAPSNTSVLERTLRAIRSG